MGGLEIEGALYHVRNWNSGLNNIGYMTPRRTLCGDLMPIWILREISMCYSSRSPDTILAKFSRTLSPYFEELVIYVVLVSINRPYIRHPQNTFSRKPLKFKNLEIGAWRYGGKLTFHTKLALTCLEVSEKTKWSWDKTSIRINKKRRQI